MEDFKKEGNRMVTIYVPMSKLNALEDEAKKNDISRNKLILNIIDKHIEGGQCKKTA